MPRQAARVVLGRSARTKAHAELSSSRIQAFSTTPRRWAEWDGAHNDNNNNNNNNGSGDSAPERRGRSLAAASALGAMSKPGEGRPIVSRGGGSGLPNTLSRPAGLGRPGNVISLKSLPNRTDGSPRPFLRSPAQPSGGLGDRPPPGSSGFTPRFAGRSGLDGFSGPPREGRGGFRGGFRGGSRGGAGSFVRGRGRGGRGARGRGARGGGRGGARGGRQSKDDEDGRTDERNDMEAEDLIGMPLSEPLQEHVKQFDEAGPVRAYKPSTTLESLIGWGPAVATNTALGQVETAMRAMRIMGGGRAYSELEQSFGITDLRRWTSAGKPIMYSRPEQKEASMKMLNPDEMERRVDRIVQDTVERLKEKYGTDYEGFVRAYMELGSVSQQREKAKAACEAGFALRVNGVDRETTTTKEAILKYSVKGVHPEVEYTEDKWGKLARYHAQGRTYRPADGAKFDEKMRSLVRT